MTDRRHIPHHAVKDANHIITAYAAGTAYTLTGSAALLDFGTTDPSIVIDKPGTYLLSARVQVKRNNSTHLADHDITLKLRRTNNTAADVSNATTTYTDEAHNASNESEGCWILPQVTYSTINADDIIQLWGSVTAAGTGGTHDVIEASIVAMRLFL